MSIVWTEQLTQGAESCSPRGDVQAWLVLLVPGIPGRLPGLLPTQPQHPWGPSQNILLQHHVHPSPFPEEATIL